MVPSRGRTRGRLLGVLGLTLAGSAAFVALPAGVNGDPVPIAAPTNAVISRSGGSDSSVSGDGRLVAFVAAPTTPTSGVTESVWLGDQANGTLSELTVSAAGIRAGNSHHPVLSGDGCAIVVETELGFDLFHDDDTGSRWDVYRKILPGCPGAFKPDEWELISSAPTGDPSAVDAVDPAQQPTVDQTGSIIAYARLTVGADGKANGRTAIDVVDTTVALGQPGRVTSAPGLPTTDPTSALTYVGQREPALSNDGGFLAYTSDTTFTVAPNAATAASIGDSIVPAWGTGPATTGPATTQILSWNRNPNSDSDADFPLRLVSANPSGAGGSASSWAPTVSANGRFVAYISAAVDIATPVNGGAAITLAPNTPAQVYRTDLRPKPADPTQRDVPNSFDTTIVSRKGDAVGTSASAAPSIDSSGQLVAFLSTATNLTDVNAPFLASTGSDVLEADLSTGAVRRMTVHPDGSAASSAASSVHLSHTGRVAVIDTTAAGELVADPSTAAPGRQVTALVSNPVLTITPLDLGTNLVGTPTKAWVTTVTNTGTSSFVPSTITLSKPSFQQTGGTCTPTVPLPPTASCTVQLVFNPSAAGAAKASLDLKETGFAATAVSTVISGSGGIPSINASPTTNQLGSAVVGQQGDSTTVTIGNLGTLGSKIAKIDVRGNNPGDFAVDTKTCINKVLGIGATCTLNVTFKPTSNGERSALVLVTATDTATTSIVLSANGRYAPSLFVPATSVDIGGMIGVGGTGFPGNHTVTLGVDTSSSTLSVTTDPSGNFLANFPFTINDLPGQGHLTVVDTGAAFAPVVSTAFVVEADASNLPVTMMGLRG